MKTLIDITSYISLDRTEFSPGATIAYKCKQGKTCIFGLLDNTNAYDIVACGIGLRPEFLDSTVELMEFLFSGHLPDVKPQR